MKACRHLTLLLAACLLPVLAHAQGSTQVFPRATEQTGAPISFGTITFCSVPATISSVTGACTNTVTVYQDQALTTPYSSAIQTDGIGYFPPNAVTGTSIWFTPNANYCYTVTTTNMSSPSTNPCVPFSVPMTTGGSGLFGTLTVTGATTLNTVNATSIGATTPGSGAFTTVTATGNITSSGIVKGESFGGATTSALQAVGGNASMTLDTTNAPANEKFWDFATDALHHLLFRSMDDTISTVNTWLTVTRSGASITGIVFGNGGNAQTLFSSTDTIVGRATTDTLTNKTIINPTITGQASSLGTFDKPTITTGVSQGSGLKHQRFGATCTTAATTGATCTTAYTWASAFADANYTPVCQGTTSTFNGLFSIESWTASTITVRVIAATANAASFAGVNCIAIHD